MHKTLEEMQELAVKTFGLDARVEFEDGSWVIYTEITEPPFVWDGLEDTPAYKASQSYECGESSLDRWARKNGHGWSSMREIVEAYNNSERLNYEHYLESCRRFLMVRGMEVPEDNNELMNKAQDELDKMDDPDVE